MSETVLALAARGMFENLLTDEISAETDARRPAENDTKRISRKAFGISADCFSRLALGASTVRTTFDKQRKIICDSGNRKNKTTREENY